MPLRNDIFMHQGEAIPAPKLPLGELKEALRGLGDPSLREAQDFLWAMGLQQVTAGAAWRPAKNDTVEFDLPNSEGLVKSGQVYEVQGKDAIVAVGVGEYNIVPLHHLRPLRAEVRREDKRSRIAQALVGTGTAPTLHETRSLLPVGTSGCEFAAALAYKVGFRPSEDEVVGYIEARYPGARVVDGDDSHPGKLALMLSFEDEQLAKQAFTVSRGAQLSGPKAPPSSRQHPPATEMLSGTTGPSVDPLVKGAEEALETIARLNPEFTFVTSSIERTEKEAGLHYEIWQDGAPLFTRAGKLTPVLAEDASPAVASIWANADGVWCETGLGLKLGEGQKDLPFASGTGPLSMHENELGANESGSYVVKADEKKGAGGVPGMEVDADLPPVSQLSERDYKRMKDQHPREQPSDEKAKQRRLERQKTVPQPMPAWLETTGSAPAASEEDGAHRETIGGPGVNVAERHEAVDEEAKDYWEGYFGDYGEKLVEDVPRRAEARLRMIRDAWVQAGHGVPSAPVVLQVLALLATPISKTAQSGDLVQSILQSRQNDPSAARAIDKMMVDFIARTPSILDDLGPQVASRIIEGVVNNLQASNPQALEKLRMRFAPETDPVDVSGQPSMWQRTKQRVKEMVSPVERGMAESERAMGVPKAPGPAPAAPAAPAKTTSRPRRPRAPSPAPSPATAAVGASVPLPKGAQAFDVEGKPYTINQPTTGKVLAQEQGVTIVRTSDGQVLRLAHKQADSASDAYAGRRPPVFDQLHFRATGFRRDGDYVVMNVVWDADASAEMAPADVVHALKTYAQQRATEKEYIDLGYIGKPVVVSCDPDVGLAEVRFRSSNAVGVPQIFIEREDDAYHAPVR